MLNPRNRQIYLEMLKPPIGFTLDCAVGTTFSLDLETLLAVPLGFALLDWENAKGELSLDPVGLLHGLRRCADRVTVFCQAGRIDARAKHHPVFAHLEPMVAQVEAPNESGVFHAKTWLVRFTSAEAVRYRFVCLSRNLTRDRSWDTVLAIDGALSGRQRAFWQNHPLGDFIAALPGLAQRELSTPRKDAVTLIADEVRRVKFDLPEGVDEVKFWPVGLRGTRTFPLKDRIDQLLIVSPFISEGFLKRLLELAPTSIISRAESLEEIAPKLLQRFGEAYILDDTALEEDSDEEIPDKESPADIGAGLDQADVRGLHAKLFIADQGWHASVWSGSANATDAAFHQNVEFLVQLRGKKSNLGINAFLGDGDQGGGFRQVLKPFELGERKAGDSETLANEEHVEATRRLLSRMKLRLRVRPGKQGCGFDMALYASDGEKIVIEQVRVQCWPVSRNQSFAQSLSALETAGSIQFSQLTVSELTAFVSFEVSAGTGLKRVTRRFVLNLPLEGAPADRLDQILTVVLSNRDRLLRYLLFLLTPDSDLATVGPAILFGDDAKGGDDLRRDRGVSLPLFEELVRTLARSPEKLDSVWRLVEDLRRTPEGAALLPDGFDEVWQPIWTSRNARRVAAR